MWECAIPSIADRIWEDQQSSDISSVSGFLPRLVVSSLAQPHVSLQNLFHRGAVASDQRIVKTYCCSEPVEL
eukprot:807693-Pelagomonas_calceolata.AAC.1